MIKICFLFHTKIAKTPLHLFCRAILKGLHENSVLSDVELNISNNEVSWLWQIYLKFLSFFLFFFNVCSDTCCIKMSL